MAYYILNSYKLRVSALQIFQALNKETNCFFLDSALASGNPGRYSILGVDPFCVIKAESSAVFSKLRETLGRFSFSIPGCALPFQCGAVGYLSYDLGAAMERKIQSGHCR
jgi:anthranilate/para-aminobenzoate synthase component I